MYLDPSLVCTMRTCVHVCIYAHNGSLINNGSLILFYSDQTFKVIPLAYK